MLLSPQWKLLQFFYFKVIFKNKTSKQRINGWGFLRVPVRSQGSFPLPEGSPLLLLRASCFFISFVFSSVPGTLQICQQKAHYCHTAVLADQHKQQPTLQTPLFVSVDQMWCSSSCNFPVLLCPKDRFYSEVTWTAGSQPGLGLPCPPWGSPGGATLTLTGSVLS